MKYNQISSAVGQYLENSNVIKNAIKGHQNSQDTSAQEKNEVSREVKSILQNMVRTETNKHWKAKFGKSTSITEKYLAIMERSVTKMVLGKTKQQSAPKPKKKKEEKAQKEEE